MANIIAEVTARIEDYRKDNKNPCKNYATQAAAEKATADAAAIAWATARNAMHAPARYLTVNGGSGFMPRTGYVCKHCGRVFRGEHSAAFHDYPDCKP